jgi:hypothetical protein
MRDLFSKLMTASMVAGAALLVSACGGSESTTAETNTSTEMNSMEPAGSMNDVTAVDASMGADANSMGNASGGNSMGGMDSNMSSSNTSGGNAM